MAKNNRWISATLGVGSVSGVLTLLYFLNFDSLFDSMQGFYVSNGDFRQQFVNARIMGYRWVLLLFTTAVFVWCLSICFRKPLNAGFHRLYLFLGNRGRAALYAVTVVLLAAGCLFFSQREWVRYQRPCWDNYCRYAELMSEAFFSGNPASKDALLAFMQSDYHANSPFVPAIVSVMHVFTGVNIVFAYRAACGMASLAAVLITFFFLVPRFAIQKFLLLPMLVLIGSNMAFARSSIFPQTDPFILLWITALMACALGWIDKPRLGNSAGCCLLLVSGLFIKLSFLPALVLLPLWRFLQTCLAQGRLFPDKHSFPVRTLIVWALIFIILPLFAFWLFQYTYGLTSNYKSELRHMVTEDSLFVLQAVSFLKVGLPFLMLIGMGWKRLQQQDYLLLSWVIVYVASLWLAGTSGYVRFYLSLLPPLALLAARGLSHIRESMGPFPMWSYVAAWTCLHYATLALNAD